MQGSNYQNTRLDGMTIFVTGANPIESLQQIEVFSGLPAAAYGPANPAGMFNFVSKRPTSEHLHRLNLSYDSSNIFTAHADLGGNIDDGGVVSYRANLLDTHGKAFVTDSSLDRKLGSLAIDVRPLNGTTVEFTYSTNDLTQKGYPGWFTERPPRAVHGRSRFAKLSIHDDSKVKIAPVHSDFWCDFGSLSLMGFAG
jgi:iron complex outermembrane receptor protein